MDSLAAALRIDVSSETATICDWLTRCVQHSLRRRGLVVAVSGGVDSAVVAALAARAMGPDRVLAVLMPERHSSPMSLELGKLVAKHFGLACVIDDLEPALTAMGCYARQDESIRTLFHDYGDAPGWTCKLTLPGLLERDRLSVFQLTVRSPSGEERSARLSPDAYRQLVAATNMKQRARAAAAYYHADRLGYAVAGTPNRLEYDQGFFVKQGDGAADVKPIAHLYKTQVYALAEYLDVPTAVRARPPTTDTFSMEQTQEEFYFALPYAAMDACLYGQNQGISAEHLAPVLGLTADQVGRVYRDIDAKRRATRYLHTPPLLVEPIKEIACAVGMGGEA